MQIAIVAPSSVPFAIGGAEKLCWGLQAYINEETPHRAELIKLPSPETGFWELLDSYRRFSELDLTHFDLVISSKYPAWMLRHDRHVCYMMHRLRGLYDTYPLTSEPSAHSACHPEIDALRCFMAQAGGLRSSLSEFFNRIERLRRLDTLPADATRFPGPFVREIVHFLDGIGLAPESVVRWAAISKTVAERARYFPPGVEPLVLYPPSDLRGLRMGDAKHLFTIGRLDSAKRIRLLVQAMLVSKADLQFKIAGTGPEEQALRRLAKDDPRIEFLGLVNDRTVEALYADAFAVLYAPYDEDYGLVTVEAMISGKPVITTTDSGGPTEFVANGENGFCVEPDPARIAECIDHLWENPELVGALGKRGRERVRDIAWKPVVEGLLGNETPSRKATAPPGRLRVTVATTYPVHPPRGGGQVRIFELYRRIAREVEVDLVTLGRPGEPSFWAEIAPGLREHRVPMSEAHAREEAELTRRANWLPITDVAMPLLYRLTPDYLEALRKSGGTSDLVVAAHPYVLPALREACPGQPLWYEAHNVEVDLKANALSDTPIGHELVDQTRAIEEACWKQAEQRIVCSEVDGARLCALYGHPGEELLVVPNGVDVGAVPFVGPKERAQRKAELGFDGVFTALFLGSWHPPNVEAVRRIIELAEELPEVNHLVVGSVGDAFARESRPSNVGFMGTVDDRTKRLILGVADVALNPMASGSGTNLKVLEYCASGAPVVSTHFGVRGLTLRDRDHLRVSDLDAFREPIEELRRGRDAQLAMRVRQAREWVERHYDWEVIAERLLRRVRARFAPAALRYGR